MKGPIFFIKAIVVGIIFVTAMTYPGDEIEDWEFVEPGADFYFEIERFDTNPIIHHYMEGLEGRVGDNINGPSLIRVPDWLEDPLGKYYLYFAHHGGYHIRLAYADAMEDPEFTEPQTVVRPEKAYESAHETVEPSSGSSVSGVVYQLRDPAIYDEDDRLYLLYSAAGENAIAIAELFQKIK